MAGAGFDEADLPGRAALVERAVAAFEATTGRPPAWGWIVPGRIEIVGKHTDYAGGRSLVAAVPRGFAVVAGPRGDDLVTAYDARWDARMEVRPGADGPAFTGWANYVAVVARRLAHNFPGAALGCDVVFASDLPRAAGVSSSSALVVGLASALTRRARLADRPEWQAALPSPLEVAGYFGAVENGLSFASLASRTGVGTHGGSEDHTAILACRGGSVSAFSYLPVRRVGDRRFPDAWRFVVMASGVEADKAGSANARYNRASLGTQALADVWGRARGGARPTLGSILAEPGAVEALADMLAETPVSGFGADELARRLAHFVAEDSRVPLVLEAIGRADAAAMGELAAASQRDADALLGNQIPETVALAGLARSSGAFAASSFGAGFGGSVWALVEAARAREFAARWQAAYAQAVPAGRDVPWFIARPAPAVVDLDFSES